ncbi:PKD domain-containing protein [Arthrobacter sp. Z1-15]
MSWSKWRIGHMVVLSIAISSFFIVPAAAKNSEGGWAPGGVKGVVRQKDPVTGNVVPVNVGTPESLFGFYYRPVCFDEENGDIDCLAGQPVECDAAPDGQYVWWHSGLKATPRETWPRYGDTPTCIYTSDPDEVAAELVGLVLTEFQTAPIDPGQFTLQPSPFSLVNMPTNLYAEAHEQRFDMTLLGQTIRIEVRPTEYEWNYGDGTIYGPSSQPGGPLPEDHVGDTTETSHVYEEPGDYFVSVAVYFSGRYSINGGPMIPIDGRALAFPPTQTVSVWEAESRSVADNCLVNPAGFGC